MTTPPSVTSKNDKNPTALPFPSSTPAPIKRDLKLRRAISCNAYWPTTSNASKGVNGGRKRRRLDTAHDERQLGLYRRHSRGGAEKPSKESKINALVGKIQESLDRRTAPMGGDEEVGTEGEMSSSLPLPERVQEVDEKSVGVRSDKSVVEPTSLSTSDYDDACFDFDDGDGNGGGKGMVGQGSDTSVENGQASAVKQSVPAAGTSGQKAEEAGAGQGHSEFSDEELDAEFLELAAAVTPLKPAKSADKSAQHKPASAPMAPAKPPPPKTSNPPKPDAPQTSVAANVATAPTATKKEPTSARKTARSKTFPLSKPDSSKAMDDEFGFGFDDDFGDDMEEIFAELTQDDLSKEADLLADEAIGGPKQNRQQEQQEQRAKAASIRMESTRHGDTKQGSDFGDDFDFAGLDGLHLSQGSAPGSSQRKGPKTIQRYLILDVAEDTYMDKRNIRRPEKVLRVQDERTQRNFAVTLRDTWLDSPVSKDAYIHVIG
ncbi:Tripartite DNA replication factor, partial [Ascosphaera atra]